MTNKLSRNEFIKSGLVTALGLLVPKPIVSIVEKFKPKFWEVRTQSEFDYAWEHARPGDTLYIHSNLIAWTPQLADHLIDNTRWVLPKQYDHS